MAVMLAGRRYVIPPTPAIGWITAITGDDLTAIIPGMIDDDDSISGALLAGEVTAAECADAAKDAIAAASGMAWWSAVRLVLSAVDSADISGELILCGVDASVVSLGGYVQAVYRLLVREADEKRRGKVDAEVGRPPAGSQAGGYDAGVAADLFDQMARQRGVRS